MSCENNSVQCSCTYDSCSNKGKCCACVSYHAGNRQLPACFFPKDAEKTYDRSFEHFVRLVNGGKA